MTMYTVYTWDHERDEWHRVTRCRKWTLRRVLRRLYGQGWSSVSVLVTNDDWKAT